MTDIIELALTTSTRFLSFIAWTRDKNPCNVLPNANESIPDSIRAVAPKGLGSSSTSTTHKAASAPKNTNTFIRLRIRTHGLTASVNHDAPRPAAAATVQIKEGY